MLLSSHLLHEIEAVADHLVMVGNGRIAADGSKTELLSGRGVLVKGEDGARLETVLRAANLTFSGSVHDGFVSRPRRSMSAGPPPRVASS